MYKYLVTFELYKLLEAVKEFLLVFDGTVLVVTHTGIPEPFFHFQTKLSDALQISRALDETCRTCSRDIRA
jgi:hypothetical protein